MKIFMYYGKPMQYAGGVTSRKRLVRKPSLLQSEFRNQGNYRIDLRIDAVDLRQVSLQDLSRGQFFGTYAASKFDGAEKTKLIVDHGCLAQGGQQKRSIIIDRLSARARIVDEEAARTLVLVRSIESSDSAGVALSLEDRLWASEHAGPLEPASAARKDRGVRSPQEEEFLLRRAELLRQRLENRGLTVGRTYHALRWRPVLSWIIPGLAFVAGLAVNELGTQRHINILSFPLLGMLVWNFAVYAYLAVDGVISVFPSAVAPMPRTGPLTRLLARLATHFSAADLQRSSAPLERGLARFVFDWLALSAPLNEQRVRKLLHASAALLATGTVMGMYMRGLGWEYRAVWESTFLDARSVHALLAFVFAPASALTGIPVPDAIHLEAIRAGPGNSGENAADWIQLYAATALIFIVIPRGCLAFAAWLRERDLQRRFPLPAANDFYFDRLVRSQITTPQRVCVVPYSYRLSEPAQQSLRALFAALLEDSVQVEFLAPIPYGGEDDYLAQASSSSQADPDVIACLFNLATTPEEENHGVLIAGIERLVAQRQAATWIVSLVDASAMRKKLTGEFELEKRLAERSAAWEKMLGAVGVPVLTLDLEARQPERWARTLRALLTRTPAVVKSL
jgi:hypothetical protein